MWMADDLMVHHVPERVVTVSIRVAFLLEQAWHRVPGGTGIAAVRTAEAMAERGDVELVGLTARHAGPPPEIGLVDFPADIRMASSRLPRFLLYESWHQLNRPRVEGIVDSLDVVHASGGAVPATRRPLVATVHDVAWRRHPEAATRRGRRMFEYWLADAGRADLVICPSEATKRELAEAGFDEERLRMVPLGVRPDRALFPEAEAAVRSVLHQHGVDGPFVLWVGTVEPRKNLQALVSAMTMVSTLGEVPLVLVGPSGWGIDIRRITDPLGSRAVIVGPVSDSEREAWMAAATVFCLPSLSEGFGLPLLEAMSAGTPVVTSAGTATEEVVGAAGLVVDPTDTGAIGEALGTVLSDRRLTDRLVAAGHERASSFTWEATAAATVSVYREAMARWGE